MPGIIDSLFVALKLDPDNFLTGKKSVLRESADMKAQLKKDADESEAHARRTTQAWSPEAIKRQKAAKAQAEADEKARKEREKADREQIERNKKVSESWAEIGKAALTTMAIIVSAKGIADYVANTSRQMAQLKVAADNAGLSVRDLFTMGEVVRANGGDSKAAQASMTGMAATLQGWRSGMAIPDKNFMFAFSSIGGDLAKDTPLSLFQKFANWSTGKSNQRVTQLGQMLGFDEGSIAEARKGGRAVAGDIGKMSQYAPTDADAKALADVNAALVVLADGAEKAGRDLVREFAPDIERAAKAIAKMMDAMEPFLRLASKLPLGILRAGTHVSEDVSKGDWGAAAKDWLGTLPPVRIGSAILHALSKKGGGTGGAGGAPAVSNADADAAFGALIHRESNGQQFTGGRVTTSTKGAIGIAQIMPGTGPIAAKLAGLQWDPGRYLNDAAYNLALGKAYFRHLMQKFGGNVEQAWAAYNWGPGHVAKAVQKYGTDWLQHAPLETRNYVAANERYLSGQGGGTQIHVDHMAVHSRAADAAGIASDIRKHLTNTALVGQANSGLR
jgi:hypothetical protein